MQAATQNKGLVQFDLPGLSGVQATDVHKAVLWLFVNRVTTAGAIDVYDVTSGWSEGTVTQVEHGSDCWSLTG